MSDRFPLIPFPPLNVKSCQKTILWDTTSSTEMLGNARLAVTHSTLILSLVCVHADGHVPSRDELYWFSQLLVARFSLHSASAT